MPGTHSFSARLLPVQVANGCFIALFPLFSEAASGLEKYFVDLLVRMSGRNVYDGKEEVVHVPLPKDGLRKTGL